MTQPVDAAHAVRNSITVAADQQRAFEIFTAQLGVRFVAEDSTHTRVELERRGFERHAAGADAVRNTVDGPMGWTACLDLYANYVAA